MTTEAPEQSTAIGRYLKEKREDADLSQDDVAAGTGFTQGAVSAWERGARIPTVKAVVALARVLPDAHVEKMLALIEQDGAA